MAKFHRKLPQGAFEIGDGRASGWMCLLIALLCALTMLTIAFPTYLTTPALREIYTKLPVRGILAGALWLATAFGLFSIMKQHRTRAAFWGLILVGICLLFDGANIQTGTIKDVPVTLGVDWMILALVLFAPAFVLIEKLNPVHKDQAVLRPEWKTDMAYFILLHLAVGGLLIVTNAIVHDVFSWLRFPSLSHWLGTIHPAFQFMLLILAVDMGQYWIHRLYHESPKLWKIHEVHHSAPHMDWLAGSRLHIFEALATRTAVLLVMTAIGFGETAINIYVVFVMVAGTFIHANFKLELGPLEAIFVTPKLHHWHHAKAEAAINKNYAIHLSILDVIFGTYYNPGKWPDDYGVV